MSEKGKSSYLLKMPRRRGSGGTSISLFPFLAVLLCTMGTLIIILMLIARQAQLSATAVPEELPTLEEEEKEEEKDKEAVPAVSAEELAERQRQLDAERQRLTQLQETRAKQQEKLQASRIALNTSQAQRNSSADELRRLRESVQKLQSEPAEKRTPRELKLEIAEKELEIEKQEKSLAAAENTARDKDGSYAILPHTGPNGTRRYPIYIECRADGAWLMPENIPLGARDFEGVLSMGNPLEAALLAKRAYLLKAGTFQETPSHDQEPYPLIIVRPSGIVYMYMVRSVLQSWKSEYGFELVNEDWKLAFHSYVKCLV